MSAPAPAAEAAAPKGKSKLMLIIGVAVALLILGGGGAFYIMSKNAAAAKAAAEAAAAEGEEGGEHEAPAAKPKATEHAKDGAHAKPPSFVPLDPFVVNLADKEADRYLQIAVTLQTDDPKFAEEIKAYMPAVRNVILLILSQKTSKDLLAREGKEALAAEIMREAVRPMGIEIDPEEEAEEEPPKGKKKKKKKPPVHNPITQVHFANFIIQ